MNALYEGKQEQFQLLYYCVRSSDKETAKGRAASALFDE